jgi:hypothetical protein
MLLPNETRQIAYASRSHLARAEQNLRAQGYTRFVYSQTDDITKPFGLTATKNPPTVKRLLGHLVWWSLPEQADMNVTAVLTAAEQAELPEWLRKQVRGTTARSAFRLGTHIESTGLPGTVLLADEVGCTTRYLTRRAADEVLLVREVLDVKGKRVRMTQMGEARLANERFQYELERVVTNGLMAEVEGIFRDLRAEMRKYLDNIHTNTVRTIVQNWLEKANRVCLRGTGGVYFVPGEDSRELVQVRDWIMSSPIEGCFSICEMWSGGANSTDDLTKSAVAELQAEIDEINGRLVEYAKNPSINDGAKMYSGKTQINRIGNLLAKLDSLEASLGCLGFMRNLLGVAERRAGLLIETSETAVLAYRTAKKPLLTEIAPDGEALPPRRARKAKLTEQPDPAPELAA